MRRPRGKRAPQWPTTTATGWSASRALGYLGSTARGGAVAHDDTGRTAASYLNEGSARSADGDSAGALHAFATAVTLDVRNVNARVFAARIHTYEGNFGEARALLDQALALDPRSVAVRMQRASLAIEVRDWAGAAADLQAATAIDERLPNLHLLKARLADATGRGAEALDELRIAQGLTDAEPLLAEILGLEARIALGMGRTDEAEKALARAESLSPVGSLAGARGDLALARGDGKAAAAAFREALVSRAQDAALERKLGQALAARETPRKPKPPSGAPWRRRRPTKSGRVATVSSRCSLGAAAPKARRERS